MYLNNNSRKKIQTEIKRQAVNVINYALLIFQVYSCYIMCQVQTNNST
jgi:hypothetical protein